MLRKYGAVQSVQIVQSLPDDPCGVRLILGKLPPSLKERRDTPKGQKTELQEFVNPLEVGILLLLLFSG